MVLLLGSRGRARTSSKSGFGQVLSRLSRWVSGGSKRERPPARSGFGLAVVALLCFAGGYFVGDRFGDGNAAAGKPALKAQTPGAIGEIDVRPLANDAVIVVGYDFLLPDVAKPKAKQMAEFLQAQGFKRARPHEVKLETGPLWLVVVYCDGEAEMRDAQKKLRDLKTSAVPDEYFAKTRAEYEKDWPIPYAIR